MILEEGPNLWELTLLFTVKEVSETIEHDVRFFQSDGIETQLSTSNFLPYQREGKGIAELREVSDVERCVRTRMDPPKQPPG